MKLPHRTARTRAFLVVVAIGTACAVAQAATLCVNKSGRGGCAKTIGDAVAAASAGDVILVAQGTYQEDVVIGKPLSLLGKGRAATVIDASGLLNGINVDGLGNPGLAHVVVSGFTVRNANTQGIVVTNASDVTISNNRVLDNDRSLDPVALQCPPLPDYFQAGEGFDCGEGIHLSGVDHSIVSDNVVERNSGGILISDDTGPNHDNLIVSNVVQDNPLDCGITLASHHFATAPTDPSVGVFRITVADNTSRRNGLVSGEGAGVGIFAGPPGAQNNADVVTGNTITGNALPGVAMHAHEAFQSLNDHVIVGNRISGNGPDADPGTTLPTGISLSSPVVPVTGIVIARNVVRQEAIDVAVNIVDGNVEVHFNDLFGRTGVDNLGAGSISATSNWWGCERGPGAQGCSKAEGSGITTDPWLSHPLF